jgi:hypothetical protein
MEPKAKAVKMAGTDEQLTMQDGGAHDSSREGEIVMESVSSTSSNREAGTPESARTGNEGRGQHMESPMKHLENANGTNEQRTTQDGSAHDSGAGTRCEVEARDRTFTYVYMTSLEPGEAAPDYAKHADVEVADTGWDKIDRVNRIAYTTVNQDVARENGFALIVGEQPSFSWGTVDSATIAEEDTEHDIYTDDGAEAALKELEPTPEELAEAEARYRREQQSRQDRDAKIREALVAAAIEPSYWAMEVARAATTYQKYSKRDSFSRRYAVEFNPTYQAAVARARSEAQAQGSQILEVIRRAGLGVQS